MYLSVPASGMAKSFLCSQSVCAFRGFALNVLNLHNTKIVQLPDFPGGVEAFELCAKFCYGITITLCAFNIVLAQCAAEYLQMTKDVQKGNLIYKIEVFFNSCILHGIARDVNLP
ncbi:hypothetical protein F0562_030137 [Nyssa sinensis]|uniref:BTB domain-containing protein n=1 Tax=Nyssa sinensis TaxID=561372 RepID=A0A5J5AXM4_9ASTE|nr:hypothetical protein F0562_030137 [Nyssa sinensis]